MIKVFSLAILAGAMFGSWAQEAEYRPPRFPNDPAPVLSELQCYHPTNLQCWTQWFDTDNPSRNGDRENLNKLLRRYPGKICPDPLDIEARTLSGLTPDEAGDVIKISDTNKGFICRKRDQPDRECADYKVRFSCPPPYCADTVCWTKWYDRDDPSGTGDWETLSNLQNQYRGHICKQPLYIEAVTTDTLTPAIYTGEKFFIYNPTTGFVCRQKDQRSGTCGDYKVRFGCVRDVCRVWT